jgi:DNA-binding NarL/FixJ family response regulator
LAVIARRNLPRILIADDHTLVAEAFKKLLDTDYEVVGVIGDPHSGNTELNLLQSHH